MKKMLELLKCLQLTICGGIFLIVSFITRTFLKINFPPYIDFAWITVFISGIPLFHLAIKRIIKNKGISKISSALLISVAMIAAIYINDIFAAGEIAFIMALGEILEDRTTDKAKKGLSKLIKLVPNVARKITENKEEIISYEDIKKGDIIRILPGETIPVDGKIILGESSVDQSVITGESLPIDKFIDDDVFCGTTNLYGSIDVKVTKENENSSLNKLIEMVKDAEKNKAPMQRIADKCASYLVPLAMLIAIIAGLCKNSITVSVTVLVVFCPCALVLATPTAIMAAIGQATKHGVIIKSGAALEKLGKVDTIVFDKTGTLTYGNLNVINVKSIDSSVSTEELISIAASAECKSEHPLGKAIYQYAKEKNIEILPSEKFKSFSGKGVCASIGNDIVFCGNERFFSENNIFIPESLKSNLIEAKNDGMAFIITSVNDKVIGAIFLSDKIKENSRSTVRKLKEQSFDVYMLTGDNTSSAKYFSKEIGIKKVFSDLLPEDKVSTISSMSSNGKKVCMVGDGINDAPSLKIADVGISMASIGSDISVEASDIAILGDDVSKIPYLLKLSKSTIKTIKLSIALSLVINILAIILSVMGLLTPTTGALVHNVGSLFVILLAAKLYDKKVE